MRATIDGPATGKHSGIGWVGRGRPTPPPAMRVAILPYRWAIPMRARGLPPRTRMPIGAAPSPARATDGALACTHHRVLAR